MRQLLRMSVLALGALSLAACSSKALLPSATSENTKVFQTYDQVAGAYGAITAGKTNGAELEKLGFGVKTAPNVEILTYVGVIDRLPQDARTKGHVPDAVQGCFDAQDRCTAYLFRPGRIESRHVGNTFLELAGFQKDTLNTGWTADIMLLVQDDVVVYKLMNGQPLIGDMQHKVTPLGPLQDAARQSLGGSKDPNDKD